MRYTSPSTRKRKRHFPVRHACHRSEASSYFLARSDGCRRLCKRSFDCLRYASCFSFGAAANKRSKRGVVVILMAQLCSFLSPISAYCLLQMLHESSVRFKRAGSSSGAEIGARFLNFAVNQRFWRKHDFTILNIGLQKITHAQRHFPPHLGRNHDLILALNAHDRHAFTIYLAVGKSNFLTLALQ